MFLRSHLPFFKPSRSSTSSNVLWTSLRSIIPTFIIKSSSVFSSHLDHLPSRTYCKVPREVYPQEVLLLIILLKKKNNPTLIIKPSWSPTSSNNVLWSSPGSIIPMSVSLTRFSFHLHGSHYSLPRHPARRKEPSVIFSPKLITSTFTMAPFRHSCSISILRLYLAR